MSHKLNQLLLMFVLLVVPLLLLLLGPTVVVADTLADTSAGTPNSRVTSELQPAASGNLSKQQVDLLVKRFVGRPHKSFKDFCLSVYGSSRLTLTESQREAVGNFAANENLSGSQREVVFRILGIYAQLKYGGEALSALNDLVVIPTVNSSKDKFKRDKNFRAASALLKRKAKDFGLKFASLNDSTYQVSFPWRKPKGSSLVIYTHVDVAPAVDQWRLEGGKAISPFSLTRVGTKFYGRGASSNKNGIIAAMFAMRVIVDENIRLFNEIKLIIDTRGLINQGQRLDSYASQFKNTDGMIALNGVYPAGVVKTGPEHTASFLVNALSEVAAESLEFAHNVDLKINNEIFTEVATEPASSAKWLEFGLLLPGQPDLSREPLEYKELEKFLLDLQMVTEMMVRVGQMRRLD